MTLNFFTDENGYFQSDGITRRTLRRAEKPKPVVKPVMTPAKRLHRAFVFAMLDKAHAKRPITLLIEGGAKGADTWAREWAVSRGVKHVIEYAEWRKYGKLAGFIRNGQMLIKYSPDGCIAFPGGRGTADMVTRAKVAGITVWEPKYNGT